MVFYLRLEKIGFLSLGAHSGSEYSIVGMAQLQFLRRFPARNQIVDHFKLPFAFADAESFRLGFAGCGVAGSAWTLDAAHLLRCASAIRERAAALIFRRFRLVGSGAAADSAGPRESIWRSSVIRVSICCFWDSKPRMAAVIISVVNCFVGMSAFRTHDSAFHWQERALPWVVFQ